MRVLSQGKPDLISLRSRLVATALKTLLRPRFNHQYAPQSQRRALELFSRTQGLPSGVQIEACQLGRRAAEKHVPVNADLKRAVLFLHGGAYVVGSPSAYRSFSAYLARACGCPVYVLDYRLAPESPYPAAQDDALSAYTALIKEIGADRVAIAGDSAGAGLCLSLMLQLKHKEMAQPACAWLMCPFADMTLRSESISRNRHLEPLLTREWLDICCEYYAAETPREDPQLSPVFADLSGLPTLLIQAAGHDILLDDARRIHALAKDAGVDSRLEVFADLGHDFQLVPRITPEASMAVITAAAQMKLRQRA